nr:MAG TPA: hypothetical protein [Caudoviricetes sp.]
MKASNKTPRALSQELGIKLSDWTQEVANYFDVSNNKQEEIFSLIRISEDPSDNFSKEERDTIRKVLSYMLSLSFIVLREKQQIEEFYEDYNGF